MDIDSTTDHSTLLNILHSLAMNKHHRDEIGVLPFLPDLEQCQGDYVQYPFVVQEQGTKLGIPIFCWVPVLDAAYGVLKDAVKSSPSAPASSSTEAVAAATAAAGSGVSVDWWQDPGRRKRVIESSACLMIFCPDSFMAVNARKRLVQEGRLSAEDEIRFLDTVLTLPRNCKSSGAWHHRKWLLCFIYRDHRTVPLDPLIVEGQLKICQEAAERYPKCYYAWTMRHWLVEHLGVHWWNASLINHGAPDTDVGEEDNYLMPLEKEFERMKSHTQRNVSDHSGQQHLQQCMVQLSGQWIVQRKVLESMSNDEVALQWTREELASRRQRRMNMRTRAGIRSRKVKRQLEMKENQEEEMDKGKETQGGGRGGGARTGYESRQSAIRTQVQDLSLLFSVVSSGHDKQEESQLSLAERRASYPWVVRLWVSELERTRDMVRTYPGHESLWYHLRYVYYGVCWLDSESELLFDSSLVGGDRENDDEEREQVGVDDVEEGDGWFVSLASERAFVEGLLTAGIREEDEAPGEENGPERLQRALAGKYLTWVERLDLCHQLV